MKSGVRWTFADVGLTPEGVITCTLEADARYITRGRLEVTPDDAARIADHLGLLEFVDASGETFQTEDVTDPVEALARFVERARSAVASRDGKARMLRARTSGGQVIGVTLRERSTHMWYVTCHEHVEATPDRGEMWNPRETVTFGVATPDGSVPMPRHIVIPPLRAYLERRTT